MSDRITTSEWLAELARLTAKSDDGLTSEELAEAWGLSDRTTMKRLRLAHTKGWVKVGRRTIERMDGKPMPVPVYTVTVPKSGRGK